MSNRKQNIEQEISRISENILDLTKRKDELVEILKRPAKTIESFTERSNNCFIDNYEICDYCFSWFNMGEEETHYHDQDGSDICRECIYDYKHPKKH